MKSTTRIRIKEKDINNNYIDVCKIIDIFDDVAGELLIRNEGHDGILKGYEELELIKPIGVGDYIDVVGQIIAFNDTRIKVKFEVYKVLDGEHEKYLLLPEIVCKAIGVFEVVEN